MRPARVFKDVKLKRPVQILSRSDQPENLYVLEQPGRIVILDRNRPDMTEPEVFLDIRPGVRMKNNEEGLLSMAFSPDVAEDGDFYLYYSASSPRRSLLSRFSIGDDGVADPDSEEILLEIEQPWGNHNGGAVVFGPDGMLYLSIGDGGAANDPMNHGQNLETLLGSVIRIDPSQSDGDRPYAVPSDNPFVGREDARPEIWAYGLRNIWRMSFDRETGKLWGGDVGQNKYEEVDLIESGGNYGWRIREGAHPFRADESAPEGVELVDPVVEYPRRDGISITGGHVYRGVQRAEAVGVYLYADYRSGRIWGIRADDGKLTRGPVQVAKLRNSLISSFGEDSDGELWICTFEGDEFPGHGAIWRFTGPMKPRSVTKTARVEDLSAPGS
jgi:glucose/arabinose dehydrogenase